MDLGFPPGAFDRIDESPDDAFYAPARLVTHIDDRAIAALTQAYRGLLPEGGVVLDLMSSWVSHLPPEANYAEVIGHGMNAAELESNPRLDRWFVQDLNADPNLPLDDGGTDAATMCVSVQYLQRPVEVFAEIARVLRPGGLVAVSFSNRCFPTKAVAVWRALDARGHAALVSLYLQRAGFEDVETQGLRDGRGGDPLALVVGRRPATPLPLGEREGPAAQAVGE